MDMEIRHRVSAAWGTWKNCSGVLCDKKMIAKAKDGDIQISGLANIRVWGRDMVNNENQRKYNGGELDEDAAMDVWSHGER